MSQEAADAIGQACHFLDYEGHDVNLAQALHAVGHTEGQEVISIATVLQRMIDSLGYLDEAIHPRGGTSRDATGGVVGSLSEAIMGVTAGLMAIAQSVDSLAEAVREHTSSTEKS